MTSAIQEKLSAQYENGPSDVVVAGLGQASVEEAFAELTSEELRQHVADMVPPATNRPPFSSAL